MEGDDRFDFEDFIEQKLGLHEISDIYCPLYQQNRCYNKSCPLIHIKLDKAVVCKHWLRGLCKKGRECEFLHEYDLKRMPECWFFSKYGECANNECYFLHVDPNKAKECAWYKRGFCRNGNYCRNKHVKGKMCAHYFYGFCKDGPDCVYNHAKFIVEVSRVDIEKDVLQKNKNIIEK
ncbi:hypothetical protein EDEG_00528 [Edhazardia aedis USNM 41457]|uniref:mRNA 3'-end-processing protein n=1 Tax=Edhazardia aedis (strain USNM 41457) TaxID=1003232 RepID=J9DIS1_EDHAE|nr:hypothetical protein EDEG_00528 [Edhazardia aedis USNM 41457]|eukprot:EJW01267.1 hypothetical protein EDEG_00528 [Edhazardia aedis USNM 41457]